MIIKKVLLILGLLFGIQELKPLNDSNVNFFTYAALTAITSGTILYWAYREPNDHKIKRVHELYQECKNSSLYGNKKYCTLYTLEQSPYVVNKNLILKLQHEIENRVTCFWNRSIDMENALLLMQELRSELEEQEAVYVDLLWQELSRYNLLQSFSISLINTNQRNEILSHDIVMHKNRIESLYHSFMYDYSKKFVKARNQIKIMYDRLQEYMSVVYAIMEYETIVAKNYNLLTSGHAIKQLKLKYAQCTYPLITAIQDLKTDVKKLNNIYFIFTYIIDSKNFLINYGSVADALSDVLDEALASNDYILEKELKAQNEYRAKMLQLEKDKIHAAKKFFQAQQDLVALYKKLKYQEEKDKKKNKSGCYFADNKNNYYSVDDDSDNYYSA